MNINIPPIAAIEMELKTLSHAELQELSRLSGVPYHTLLKIRSAVTENPGIETVRQFYEHISSARKASDAAKSSAVQTAG